LLARELITGKMQLGYNSFVDVGAAQINVAGDPDDPEGATYASFQRLPGYQPIPAEWKITQTLDRKGTIGDDPSLASFSVSAAYRAPETNHNVASVFWSFMTGSGTVYDGAQYGQGPLFKNPFYATGLPITEAYWTNVKLGGKSRRVLVQAFERRILTYTPDNSDNWKVEAGNVGRHYYEWRYGGVEKTLQLQSAKVWSRRDSTGNWVFLGDLRNRSRAAQDNVRVTVTLLDKADKQLAAATSSVDLSVVGAGESVPFRVWFDSGIDYDHFTVDVSNAISARSERAALTPISGQAIPLIGGSYRVTTTVRNDGSIDLSRPIYVVALCDGAGRVADYASGFLTLSTLQPGMTASLDVTFINPPQPITHSTVDFSC
jgi:hypothetical protein